MSTETDTADADLQERLREKIAQRSAGGDGTDETDSTTRQEADHDDEDGEDDDEDMEMDMAGGEEMEEAMQMIAEAANEDVTPQQVGELLSPLLEGEDTRDDEAELAGDEVDIEEAVSEAVDEAVDEITEEARAAAEEAATEALPDDIITEEQLEGKLDDVAGALADETRDILQKAETNRTPTPTESGGSGSISKDDLFADSGGDDE